ncbi:MAG TPA: ABC transporter substrate-binding protein, partial [Anaerolineaceae bacterium]|nr:ABC transporter substrate-binding protein [Anaerolineaceae bacterium]
MKTKGLFWTLSLLVIASMVLAACAPTAPQAAGESEPEVVIETQIVERVITATPPAVEPPVYEGPYEELLRAKAGEFAGTSVTIFGNYTAQDEAKFRAALLPFAEQTGIDVTYEGSADFAQLITVRIEAGTPPDIAEMSQAALMSSLASEGHLVALDEFMDADQLQKDYMESWLNLGTVDGKLYGIFYRANTKSIVWYPVPQFEEAGYEIPTTWDELIALSDEMVANGHTPWCISMEHGSSTGWLATDWIEDVLLRTAGAEVYDQWVNHEIPFDAPEIKEAAGYVEEIFFNSDYVYGGTDGILNIWVGDT